MSQSNSLSTVGLIDYLRESTEAALDLSKNLTAAQSPGDFLHVWTRFAEGQYSAAEKLTCRLTGRTLSVLENRAMGNRQTNGSSHPSAPASGGPHAQEAEHAALIFDIHEQMDALSAQIAVLADKLAALEGRTLKVKFSFGEPPHTGWTPSKVVVLGHDANGNLIELPSTIEEGGFRYTGAPSFWIAIG